MQINAEKHHLKQLNVEGGQNISSKQLCIVCALVDEKPVQISPEQLVGLVGDGHFAIRDSWQKNIVRENDFESC